MEQHACAFIGGKQIGVDCLRRLLERGIVPSVVIGNMDDDGRDASWHESLIRVAEEAGIPVIRKRKVREADVIEHLRSVAPEIIFCIGGMQIIPKEVLQLPRLGCLNIHPALLPKYRGRYSTVHAIANGEEQTGVTIHWMDEGIDSGPVIMQRAFRIEDDDTGKTLYGKFTVHGGALFGEFLDLWLSGKEIAAVPQNESEATYYPKGMPNGGVIDWSWDGRKIRNFIRAMTFEPFPPAAFQIGDKKMVIIDERFFSGFGSAPHPE
jgi:methionyl-tRNA formyltransferase